MRLDVLRLKIHNLYTSKTYTFFTNLYNSLRIGRHCGCSKRF